MTVHTFTATATDTMGADDTDTATINSVAAAPMRTVRRSFMTNRIMWGSAIDSTPRGPSFTDDTVGTAVHDTGTVGHTTPPDPVTISTWFKVEAPVRFVGCRVYKAPNAVQTTITMRLWSATNATSTAVGTELETQAFGPWVADDGGWQEIIFDDPVDLVEDTQYVVGYYSESGIYAFTNWWWHAQDTVVWPLRNIALAEASGVRSQGSAVGYATGSPGVTFPNSHYASGYYIDPIIEYEVALPAGFDGDAEYHEQWTVPHTRHAFPIAVFFADPPYLEEYYDMGVNTLVAGTPHFGGNAQAYIDAMAATGTGHSMDWWPNIAQDSASLTFSPSTALVQLMTENPDTADQIVGYHLWDEPDLGGTYRTPDTMRGWANVMRARDSTRPIMFGFGRATTRNQGFAWAPSGAGPLVWNEHWRTWSEITDIMAVDDYSWFDDNNASGNLGVWAYAAQVGRMREICDDRKPVWITVETTSQVAGAPIPDNVVKAIWACLIAGARGIILFDHRFANDFVTQDFAAMLHDPAMKAAVSALCAQLQTLGPALLSPDTDLVTAWTSSNTTAGPMGGTFGVPLHYTTRSDGTYEYCFAQAIRPGATTATITIPTWASEVVDVLGESRTETVSVSGVISDSFAADYQYHLYRRTL